MVLDIGCDKCGHQFNLTNQRVRKSILSKSTIVLFVFALIFSIGTVQAETATETASARSSAKRKDGLDEKSKQVMNDLIEKASANRMSFDRWKAQCAGMTICKDSEGKLECYDGIRTSPSKWELLTNPSITNIPTCPTRR